MIKEDFKAQLKTKLTLKADNLREINKKKEEVQAELERIKLEIKEINLKHKDQIQEENKHEEGSNNLNEMELNTGVNNMS